MAIYGFMGAGNMGGALVRGALASGAAAASQICVYDADRAKAEALCDETGAALAGDAHSLVRGCDVVVLAMKPADAPGALADIGAALAGGGDGDGGGDGGGPGCGSGGEPGGGPGGGSGGGPGGDVGGSGGGAAIGRRGKLILSVVLGLSTDAMRAATGGRAQYARVMPNTPALVTEGMSCVAFADGVDPKNAELASRLLSSVGQVQELPEAQLINITALTGSSPAYVFVMLEAMADAAVHDGIPRDIAYRLAAQAVLGSAKMARDTRRLPADLKDAVCSPAGSTIAAIRVLETAGFRGALIEAMLECNRRAREIADGQLNNVNSSKSR